MVASTGPSHMIPRAVGMSKTANSTTRFVVSSAATESGRGYAHLVERVAQLAEALAPAASNNLPIGAGHFRSERLCIDYVNKAF